MSTSTYMKQTKVQVLKRDAPTKPFQVLHQGYLIDTSTAFGKVYNPDTDVEEATAE